MEPIFIIGVIGLIVCFIVTLNANPSNEPEKGYNATFGSEDDALSSWNKGFCLGGKAITVKESLQNAMVIGSTGSGKSVNIVIPTLLRAKPEQSYIVHDPSGEVRLATSGYLQSQGFEILTLNFSDPEASEGYNPLSAIKGQSDIQRIADMLVKNTLGAKQSSDFWALQSVSLLTLIISIIKEQAPEHLNLTNVRHLLNAISGNQELIDELFSRTNDQTLYDEYKTFLSYDEKIISGVVATCKASTNIFANPAVARITSSNTLSLESIRKEPSVLFIQTSVPDQKYFSVLNAIFFEQLFGFFMRKLPASSDLTILMLIDEAGVLGHLPTLSTALSNIRKYRVGGLFIYQSFQMIQHHFSRDESDSLKSNSYVKLILGGGGQPIETYKELEATMGKFEYYQDEDNKTGRTIEPLFKAESMRLMDTKTGLLIMGNKPPIKVQFEPYYDNWTLKRRSEIAPAEFEAKTSNGSVPLINLQKSDYEKGS